MTPAATPGSSFDFARGLTFFFKQRSWFLKLLVLTALSLTCVVGLPFVAGYEYRIIRRAVGGEREPAPDWSDFGGLFVDGLRLVAFQLGHLLALFAPAILFGALATVLAGGAGALDLDGLQDLWGRSPASAALVVGCYGLGFLALMVAMAYMPAARTRFAVTGSFRSGADIEANLAFIRRNLGNYLLQYALFMAANVLSNAGYLLCCVGIIPAAAWTVCVMAWGEGEVVRCDPAFR